MCTQGLYNPRWPVGSGCFDGVSLPHGYREACEVIKVSRHSPNVNIESFTNDEMLRARGPCGKSYQALAASSKVWHPRCQQRVISCWPQGWTHGSGCTLPWVVWTDLRDVRFGME